jgi:hypothetical protein
VFEHINKDPCGSCTLTELYPLLVASTLHFGASAATFDDCADRCSIDPNHELEAADIVALLNVLISTAAEKAQAARLRPRVIARAAVPTAIGASPVLTSATTSAAVAPSSTAQPLQQQQQQHVTIAAAAVVPASSGASAMVANGRGSSRASMKAQAKQQAQQQRYLQRAAKKATPTAETVAAYFEAKYDSQQQQQQ